MFDPAPVRHDMAAIFASDRRIRGARAEAPSRLAAEPVAARRGGRSTYRLAMWLGLPALAILLALLGVTLLDTGGSWRKRASDEAPRSIPAPMSGPTPAPAPRPHPAPVAMTAVPLDAPPDVPAASGAQPKPRYASAPRWLRRRGDQAAGWRARRALELKQKDEQEQEIAEDAGVTRRLNAQSLGRSAPATGPVSESH